MISCTVRRGRPPTVALLTTAQSTDTDTTRTETGVLYYYAVGRPVHSAELSLLAYYSIYSCAALDVSGGTRAPRPNIAQNIL